MANQAMNSWCRHFTYGQYDHCEVVSMLLAKEASM